MDLSLTLREKWALRAIYTIIPIVAGSAMLMAFEHARSWADRHATTGAQAWEGWAFGIMIELPAALGLLLIQIWAKIAPGQKRTVPRLLLTSSLGISFIVQQAYAGSDAAVSTRIVAGLPSLVGYVFVEILFMLLGLVDAARRKADMEAKRDAEKVARQRVGLADIPDAPTLTQPDMSDARHHDTEPNMSADVRDDTTPDRRPDITRHDSPTSTRQEADIPQLSGDVMSGSPVGRPWADLPDIDPDSELAERVAEPADVLTADRTERPDPAPDTEPDVRSSQPDTTPDMSTDTDAKRMSNPLWLKAAEMRRNGATLKEISERIGKDERTLSRWKLPKRDSTKPMNGHDLTGANR